MDKDNFNCRNFSNNWWQCIRGYEQKIYYGYDVGNYIMCGSHGFGKNNRTGGESGWVRR